MPRCYWSDERCISLIGHHRDKYNGDQGVIERCRLSWLTNSALVYEPKCGGMGWGGLGGLWQWVQLCTVHYVTWSPNKILRSTVTPYVTYDGDREKSAGQAHLRSMWTYLMYLTPGPSIIACLRSLPFTHSHCPLCITAKMVDGYWSEECSLAFIG